MLPVRHDVERGDAAFRQAFEHVTFPAHRRHDQGGLKETYDTHVTVAAP